MITAGDDYPLHQTPEPIAFSGGNRNFYDRYFFNGYAADGSLFFAGALGVYPQLDVMDAAFCVSVGDTQHNLRASRRLKGGRLDLTVGPIRVEIVEPLQRLRLTVGDNDSGITCDVTFEARHAPIEEPRFTRREGARLMMDYTRMTQNGAWSGSVTVDGETHDVAPATFRGTRDRSWGIRPVGAPESQPPAAAVTGAAPQFWWLWTPLNFDAHCVFFHSNDDAKGDPWNRRGVVDALPGDRREFEPAAFDLGYRDGARRVKSATIDLAPGQLTITPRSDASARTFYMSGLGYMHPEWGHGMDHGEKAAFAYDRIALDPEPAIDLLTIHIQALSDAVLELDGARHEGVGVTEQLFLGAHGTSGLTGVLDGAGSAGA